MSSKRAQELLIACGWEKRNIASPQAVTEGIRQFQRGFGFGLLVADGDDGGDEGITRSAMEFAAALDGACTENFAFAEFKSYYGQISLHRDLPRGLEVIRKTTGAIGIVGGYRDPKRNAEVGGAKYSVHLTGGAADALLPTVEQVCALGIFSGIGAELAKPYRVRHVDVRGADASVLNRSGGSPSNPTFWGYTARGQHVNRYPNAWRRYSTGPGLPALATWKRPGQAPAPTKHAAKLEVPATFGSDAKRDELLGAINQRLSGAELMLNKVRSDLATVTR